MAQNKAHLAIQYKEDSKYATDTKICDADYILHQPLWLKTQKGHPKVTHQDNNYSGRSSEIFCHLFSLSH